MEEVLAEAKVILSLLQSDDRHALYAPSVDDLFVSHKDVWLYVKEYHEKYGALPSVEMVHEVYPEALPDITVKGDTRYHLDTLRTEYIDNRVEALITRAADARTKGVSGAEVKLKLQEALGGLDRFSSTARDLKIMDFDEAKRYYDEVREKAEATGGTPGVPTGVDFIDACMPLGMQGGDVMSIIGYPGRGKSALGALFAAKAILRGYKPLIFTLEMPAEAVRDRIFTIQGNGTFSNTELMLGMYDPDDFRTFASKYKGEADQYIVDGTGISDITPNFIRGKIDQYHPDFVLMDYMQLFHDNNMTEEMTPRMRNLSSQIKSLANRKDIPIVVISSATPPDGGRVDGPPNPERSAWSRQLAYDATVGFTVHRFDDTNIYQIDGGKNRYGPLFSGFLDWDMDRGTYEEKFEI